MRYSALFRLWHWFNAHIGGVAVAEVKDENGLIFSMISGDKKS